MTDYENSINSLISEAEREAKKEVNYLDQKGEMRRNETGPYKGQFFVWDFQTEFFHAAMNRLAKEAGLRQLD